MRTSETVRPRRRAGRPAGALVALTALTGTWLGAPGGAPAHAALGDLVCTANFQGNFSPPLTAQQTTADIESPAGFVNRLSPNGRYPALQSGVGHASGTGVFEGNTGQDSESDGTIVTDPAEGTLTLSAVITSGPLAGDALSALPFEADPNPDRATAGLKSLASAAAQVFSARCTSGDRTVS
ncbi:hypothetical protein [Streptomyces sp. URMC 129]|uniref:hypothetical protein n=1 Tax=Streptomyces sp. URMC 129 TaxID=3423407 RepID=UPI003F1B78CE